MAADLVTYGILVLVLLFVFFGYLMLRRTVLQFKKGVNEKQERK
jgi:hypothetical protein